MDKSQPPCGITMDEPTAEWVDAALELRISPRGNDGEEAVGIIVGMIRRFAEERAKSIVISRRQKTVIAELKADRAIDKMEKRRLARVKAILDGDVIGHGIHGRGETRQKALP